MRYPVISDISQRINLKKAHSANYFLIYDYIDTPTLIKKFLLVQFIRNLCYLVVIHAYYDLYFIH